MNSKVLPPPPKLRNFITFTFNNGKYITSRKVETIKTILGVLESMTNLDKQNAYITVDNTLVFLTNVDSISWNLIEEELA